MNVVVRAGVSLAEFLSWRGTTRSVSSSDGTQTGAVRLGVVRPIFPAWCQAARSRVGIATDGNRRERVPDWKECFMNTTPALVRSSAGPRSVLALKRVSLLSWGARRGSSSARARRRRLRIGVRLALAGGNRVAPILLSLLPCAAMCAVGLCMIAKGGQSSAVQGVSPGTPVTTDRELPSRSSR